MKPIRFLPLALVSLVAAMVLPLTPSAADGDAPLRGLNGSLESITGFGSGGTGEFGVSANGRFVVFTSHAANLTPNDTNGHQDVFLYDDQNDSIINITEGFDDTSHQPDISGDGTTVIFTSRAQNQGFENPGYFSLFTYDVASGEFDALGATGRDISDPSLSYGGFYAAVVVGTDVWRLDFESLDSSDQITLGRDETGSQPQISANGSHVVFVSSSPSMDRVPQNGRANIFRWTRDSFGESIIGLTPNANEDSWAPDISTDGSRVIFTSRASNLTDGDLNGHDDLFMWGDAGRGIVSLTPNANSWTIAGSISGNGKRVAITTSATNLATNVAGPTADQNSVVLWDEVTQTYTSLSAVGDNESSGGTISLDGGTVAFWTSATNLVVGDTNGQSDTLVWKDPLPRPDPYLDIDGPTFIPSMESSWTFDEFVNARDFDPFVHGKILRLYPAFFNRQPDLEGAQYWILQVYADGHTIDQITAYFSDPAQTEFVKFYEDIAPDDHEAYLNRVYQNMLGRQPDTTGFNYWLGLMKDGTLDRGSVVRWVALNEEFIALNDYGN